MPLGEVAQVTLVNPGPPQTYYTGNLTIEWPKDPHVSFEVTLVSCQEEDADLCYSPGAYVQNRYAFQGPNPPNPSDQSATPPYTWQDCTVTGNTCSASILLPSGTNPIILRIKPFHSAVNLKVSGSPDLPTQIYEINSVAKTDLGITRRVQVTRTALPALPAVFDYVLYSEGDIVK